MAVLYFTALFLLELGLKNAVRSQNICPDQSVCSEGTTCCQMVGGNYGCCPLTDAVCCEDKQHCCPANTQCDLIHMRCTSQNSFGLLDNSKSIALFPILSTASVSPQSTGLKCGNKAGLACPLNTTCCSSPFGHDGCCPIPKGECCSDFLHCCPENFVCDVNMKSCVKDNVVIPWFLKMSLFPFEKKVNENTQERKKYLTKLKYLLQKQIAEYRQFNVCSADEAVCNMDNDNYGCCQFSEAVCCSDKLHCCPTNSECDVEAGTCRSGIQNDNLLVIEESPLYPLKRTLIAKIKYGSESNKASGDGNVMCEDKTVCGDNDTCCLVGKQQFGCCPYEEGVCCSDLLHCCPHGTVCNPKYGCIDSGPSVNFQNSSVQAKIKEIKRADVSVICPDKKHKCADESTCCLLSSGSYGCCPYPDAVCCRDKIHCCPNGYTCDLQTKTCIESPKTTISSSLEKSQLTATVICPDKKERCTDNTTCCKTESGQYGCCQFPHAVCCSDEIHCCPNGYTCDLQHMRCIKKSESSALQKLQQNEKEANVICPDKETHCADNTTCCKGKSGQYGCCRFPHAVCCSDEEHCCPEGYTCDLQQRKCVKKSETVPFWQVEQNQMKDDIVCPGGNFTCPTDFTCCPLKTGGVGCCRWKEAVCCDDGLSCCPHNTVCDVETGECLPKIHSIPWEEKTMASKIASVEDNTNIQGIKIGNSNKGIGNSFYIFIKCFSQKTEAIKDLPNSDIEIVCPGGAYRCPSDNTCCKMYSGRWGCCRAPFAVCCSDGRHCCPHGYRCTGEGRCAR